MKLKLDFFKNFLMDVDVSVVIDLRKYQVMVTYERSTKYKGFIELFRQVGKIFEILHYLDLGKKEKLMGYLRHYKRGLTKEFLVFQVPLGKDSHLDQRVKAVSFVLGFNEKNLMQQHKMEAQGSSSLSVQVVPNFAQSFLL